MSSFVRAVLSASGALTPKEDLSATISRLEKRGGELKSLLRVEVESTLETLGSGADIQEAISKLESIKVESESLLSGIQSEKSGPEGASEEVQELLHRLESLTERIGVAGSIKDAWSLLEKMEDALRTDETVEASKVSQELAKVLASESGIDEDQTQAFAAIQQEFISSLSVLQEALSSSWDSKISIETTPGTPIKFIFAGSPQLQDILSALQTSDLLSHKINSFAESFLSSVLTPVMTQNAVVVSENDQCLRITLNEASNSTPQQTLDYLRIILSLMSTHPLTLSDSQTFLGAVSEIIRERFLGCIINDILSKAVPNDASDLEGFKDEMGKALKSFEVYLKAIGFLQEDSSRLMDFIEDLDTIFVNKKLCNYLLAARKKMKEPLYETMEVSPDLLREENALLKLKSKVGAFPINEEDLPLPDKGAFSSDPFTFPKCRISKSVWELRGLIYSILDEAAQSPENIFLSSRLLQGSRYIFELYLNMVHIVHEEDFKKLPQVSAVAHNDCYFLAHHCIILGFHYRNFIPLSPQDGQYLTFVDFIPSLRENGEKILIQQIDNQKKALLEQVQEMDINSGSTDVIFRRISHGFHHLKKVWSSFLPENVYPRIIGAIINSTLEALIEKVVILDNIVADSAVQTYNAFSEFGDTLPSLFAEEHQPLKYVRYWLRFKELIFILNANLREIEHRWAERKGPLAAEFSVDEIKRLIRAIFQNTERRATVLSRIK